MALSIYQNDLAKDPQNDVALHYLGLLQHQLKNDQKAISLLKKALQLKRLESQYLGNLGLVFMQLQRYPEAQDALVRAIKLNPADLSLKLKLANTYKNSGKLDKAVEYYDLILEKNPINSAALLCTVLQIGASCTSVTH